MAKKAKTKKQQVTPVSGFAWRSEVVDLDRRLTGYEATIEKMSAAMNKLVSIITDHRKEVSSRLDDQDKLIDEQNDRIKTYGDSMGEIYLQQDLKIEKKFNNHAEVLRKLQAVLVKSDANAAADRVLSYVPPEPDFTK